MGVITDLSELHTEDAVAVMAGERLSDRVVHYNVRRRSGDLAARTAVADIVSVFSQKTSTFQLHRILHST